MAARKTKSEESCQPLDRPDDDAGAQPNAGADNAVADPSSGPAPDVASSATGDPSLANAAGTAGDADGSLRDQLEAARAERDANRDNWLRAQADLENYRKRVQREMDEASRYRVLPLARDVLPVLDNLRRALTAAEEGGDTAGLVEGVRLVVKQFEDVLARHSVTPIAAVGQPFDPNLHEALQQVPSRDHPPMTVLEEFQRGYRLHDRVLRPSQVVVSRGTQE